MANVITSLIVCLRSGQRYSTGVRDALTIGQRSGSVRMYRKRQQQATKIDPSFRGMKLQRSYATTAVKRSDPTITFLALLAKSSL